MEESIEAQDYTIIKFTLILSGNCQIMILQKNSKKKRKKEPVNQVKQSMVTPALLKKKEMNQVRR